MSDLKDELREFFAGVYEIDEELRGGGMSRLFIASDTTLRRKVVIKILPPDFSSEVMALRFKREAQLTAGLQHPHILPIISAGSAKGLLYYVMPFVDGESLRARMNREGALAVPEALRLLMEIADALALAHANGVIHRDIKPENILLQGGHAVVADFGIAGALDSGVKPRLSGPTRLTSTGISLGTVGYMAPEQSVGERHVDARADVYSLGVIGYEMIAGRRLFEGESAQEVIAAHLTRKPVPLDRTADGVPMPVVMAIEKALAKNPDDRFQNAAEFRDALRAHTSAMTTMTRAVPAALIRAAKRRAAFMRSRKAVGVAAIAVIALAGGIWWSRVRASAAAPTDVVRVAVAPFDILGEDPIWREGMVDLMARNLDGAGTLHTVSPTLVLRQATGTINRRNATQFGRNTGAAYAIYGRVTASQVDSVTLTASVVDVVGDSVILSDRRWTGATVPALVDSLAITVIEELGRRHRLGAVRRPAPRGTSSIAALRHFLQGEQLYRRTRWDSALVVYERSSAEDTNFALPLHRRAQLIDWLRSGDDSTTRALELQAGMHNRGLAPRDSLLVVADSLSALALVRGQPNWGILRRLFATLEYAVAVYPDDAEAWYLLAEARYHRGYGRGLGVTDEMVLQAFDKAIASDSSFGPAYLHTPELALQIRGARAARRYAELYVAREPSGKDANGIRLVAQLLRDDAPSSGAASKSIDTLAWSELQTAFLNIRRWPDSSQSALRILQSAARRPRNRTAYAPDTVALPGYLSTELAFRGHMLDAFATAPVGPTLLVAELATLGAIPRDTATARMRAWLSTGPLAGRSALAWWAQENDTTAIRDFARRMDSIAAIASVTPAVLSRARYNRTASDAYMALVRHDTTAALTMFAVLSDTACLICYMDRYTEARLLRARGRYARADTLLRQRMAVLLTPMEVPIALERAELAAIEGRAADAKRQFAFVLEAWRDGDASLEPYMRRATEGLAKINGTSVAAVTAK